MTTEPQADPRSDDDREHRTIGQRIRDAVLGEPPDEGGAASGTGTRTGYAEPQVEGSGYDASGRDAGYADQVTASSGVGATAPQVDAGRDRGGVADTARDATGLGDTSSDTRGHLAQPAVPDPVRDDVTQDGAARGVDRDRAGYADDRGGADRDLVTSSYDPDRDRGYDPQAAGTALADPDGRPADRTDELDTRSLRDSGGDTRSDTGGYDPTRDTGYVDERRGDLDAAAGRGDLDATAGRGDSDAAAGREGGYDTGRVDTQPGSAERSGGVGTGAAVAAGGAAAAAGLAAGHHRDRDDRGGFSEVDDSSTVDASSTGQATGDRPIVDAARASGTAGGERSADRAEADRAEAVADEANEAQGSDRRERLVPADRADHYSSRWDALKGDFVDEPRRAVAQADDLVGELLDEIQRLFADQRRDLEQGFDHDRASTEDLRLALRRYRSFFDRLLSF